MPYSSKADLPDSVKELPDKLQEAFLKAFNAAYKQYDGDEEKAFATAWSVVNKMKKENEMPSEFTNTITTSGTMTTSNGVVTGNTYTMYPEMETTPKREASSKDKVRMLNFDISGSQFQEIDGGLLVKDVLVLDEGEWSDSNVGTPLYYTVKALSKYYDNWKQRGVWTRHMGGSPRDITDKAGTVKNLRFQNTGIWADLFLHCRTAKSRDTAELIRSGEVNAVSVEHSGEEEYNSSTRRWESKTLEFYGLAIVDRGACETCVIRKKSIEGPCDTETQIIENEATSMKDEEITKMFADMKSEFESRIKGLEDAHTKAEAPEKELSAKVESLTKELAEYKTQSEARIKELENTPVLKGVSVVDTPALRTKVDIDLFEKI